MTEFEKAKAAQRKLCEEKGYPHFAPTSGVCWSCNRAIYMTEADGKHYITGCPWCHRTYCD